MPSTKCKGLSYPTHFLKSRVVLLGIIFLNTEVNKLHLCATKGFYVLFSTNKAKHILMSQR